MLSIFVIGFKFANKECGVDAQEMDFRFQTVLLFFSYVFSIPGRFFCVGFRLSVLIVGCICRWKLSGYVGCRVLTVDCRLSLSVVVVGSWLLVVDSLVLPVVRFFLCRCPPLAGKMPGPCVRVHETYFSVSQHRRPTPRCFWFTGISLRVVAESAFCCRHIRLHPPLPTSWRRQIYT